ncbi:MAG TPA: S-layer homology domain-containing protein [Bryobacteraceae bacterium]|nr:S-layer homology domain-containing protein [Bryobacteraceae bacterium]
MRSAPTRLVILLSAAGLALGQEPRLSLHYQRRLNGYYSRIGTEGDTSTRFTASFSHTLSIDRSATVPGTGAYFTLNWSDYKSVLWQGGGTRIETTPVTDPKCPGTIVYTEKFTYAWKFPPGGPDLPGGGYFHNYNGFYEYAVVAYDQLYRSDFTAAGDWEEVTTTACGTTTRSGPVDMNNDDPQMVISLIMDLWGDQKPKGDFYSQGATPYSGSGPVNAGKHYAATTGPQTESDEGLVMTYQANVSWDYSYAFGGCTYAVSPASMSFPGTTAWGSFAVKATSGCYWVASSDSDWIAAAAAGSGDGQVDFGLSANPGAARTGTITVAGQVFTISQAPLANGTAGNCTFTISPTAATAPPGGATGTVAITASGPECPWTASSNAYWITLSGAGSGTGSGSVTYAAGANSAANARTGTISLAGTTFPLTQSGSESTGCTYSLSPVSASFGAQSGSGTVSLATATGCSWAASAAAAWITIGSAAAGSGPGSIAYSVTANSAPAPRAGSITAAGEAINIIQSGTDPAAPFADVTAGSPYADYIRLMSFYGITSGCSTTSYCPDASVTRGQMAVFIVRALSRGGSFPYSNTPYFVDVPASHPFFQYIQRMKDLGITAGCGGANYCPDSPVTRGQMAVFLVRGVTGNDFTFTSQPYFTDVPAGHPLFAYIQKLRDLGITSGCSATAYCPDTPNTRAQMAVFLNRAFLTAQ